MAKALKEKDMKKSSKSPRHGSRTPREAPMPPIGEGKEKRDGPLFIFRLFRPKHPFAQGSVPLCNRQRSGFKYFRRILTRVRVLAHPGGPSQQVTPRRTGGVSSGRAVCRPPSGPPLALRRAKLAGSRRRRRRRTFPRRRKSSSRTRSSPGVLRTAFISPRSSERLERVLQLHSVVAKQSYLRVRDQVLTRLSVFSSAVELFKTPYNLR